MKVTNNSNALQGVHSKNGVVYIAAGASKDVSLSEEGLKLAKRLPFLSIEAEEANEVELDRDDLKKQAEELGLEYARNITTEKLKELIDAKLAS
jgi:hypothetical protein